MIEECVNMKKIYFLTTFVILLLVSFLGITYSFEYEQKESLIFELIGPSTLYMDVNTKYVEYGIKVLYNNVDISDKVKIDISDVDTNTLGEYKVKYAVNIEDRYEYIYREIVVIDKKAPVIELLGGEQVSILIDGNYQEYGFIVSDNYDEIDEDEVSVEGSVDTSKEGTYKLTYKVKDNSGNIGMTTRDVIVKKTIISVDNGRENIFTPTSYNVTKYSNTIVKNNFNSNGIYYEGYVKNKSDSYRIRLKNRENSMEYVYNMSVMKDNYYSGNMDLTLVRNGVYDVYIVGNEEEKLLNKLSVLFKIVRSKVGNKLVTVSYVDDSVTIEIEDFKYEYDIVIDPGHGGTDIGASNGIMLEKDINLKISKYEKCRYESMGYKVYMVRNDDTYGEMLGDNNLDRLDRRALTIGYYGAVSRVSYSNHHNGSVNLGDHGFEIITSNQATLDDLVVEVSLYNKFKKLYNINDDAKRLYSKDYDTQRLLNKLDGSNNSNMNFYAVIRIPYELFSVNNTIYEPIYMSNSNDFNWYYTGGNWIKVSEIKIEEYINYLGGTYKKDNSMCL